MKTTAVILSLLFSFALGCNKSKDEKKAEDPATAGKTTGTEPATPETPTAAADAAPAAAAPGEIPTEQDFEEKAATEVTKDNVEAEVEKIEKEISAEQAAAGGGAADPAAGGEKAPAAGEPAPK
jgi:hypothetical protein